MRLSGRCFDGSDEYCYVYRVLPNVMDFACDNDRGGMAARRQVKTEVMIQHQWFFGLLMPSIYLLYLR